MISLSHFNQGILKFLILPSILFNTSGLIFFFPLMAVTGQAGYRSCRDLQSYFNNIAKKSDRNIKFSGFEKSEINPPFTRDGGIFRAEYPYCFGGYIVEESPRGTYVCLGSIIDTSSSRYSDIDWRWGRYGLDHAWTARKSEYCRWRN
jgi:hypothetical protein